MRVEEENGPCRWDGGAAPLYERPRGQEAESHCDGSRRNLGLPCLSAENAAPSSPSVEDPA